MKLCKNKNSFWILLGLLFATLYLLPYFILGEGSIVTYHDQLDGELLNYIVGAKYLFSNVTTYPELMNGLPATGAVPPAPIFVLLFAVMPPFHAFLFTHWILAFTGFAGMYLLLHKLTGQRIVPFFTACVFMILPFYPVYGLCIPGQPLLWYCMWMLEESECSGKRCLRLPALPYFLGLLFYALSSSLVLVGFGILLVAGLRFVYVTLRTLRKKETFILSPLLSLSVLLVGYLTCNLPLISQILFPKPGELSHKTEVVYSAVSIKDSLRLVLYPGIPYTESWHWILLILIPLNVLAWFLAKHRKNSDARRILTDLLQKSCLVLLFVMVISLFYMVYNGETMTLLKNSASSIISAFNLGRLTWLLPTAWCVLIGLLSCALVYSLSSKTGESLLRYGMVSVLFGLWGITILLNSPYKLNLAKLVKGDSYYALDWHKFFASDIFVQIDEAIGLPKEEYRVISVGIYPAAAAYNGFYCLDGYSNNYPLTYKHEFRQIIARELEKSDYLRAYYDDWGNRCYMAIAELPGYYTFEKKWNTPLFHLEPNIEKLREMNCRYIFSAAYLVNYEELGLKMLRDQPFETEGSWYHIYVYEIN